MGNSFKKIEEYQAKSDTYDTVDSLGWSETQNFVDTVNSLNWNDTVNTKQESDTIENSSSPFVSTELFKKIIKDDNNNMEGGVINSTSSLNIEYMEDSSSSSSPSSTDTSDLDNLLSFTTDYSKKKSQTGSSIEAYGFSNTSSELSQKFVINSDTSISKINNTSSINTSDINLVSIDKNDSEINYASAKSVSGKRYL